MNKIGCNTINVDPDCRMGVYSSETYERILKKYSRYTDWIKTLEFSHVTGITPEDAVRIGVLARSAGLTPWSIHSEHLNVGDCLEDYLAIQKHCAEVCAALGCEVMVCHLPNLRPYVDFARDLDIIGRVAELTHANGVRLAVETCIIYENDGKNHGSDLDLVLRVVNALNMSDVGINVDTGHCFLAQTHEREELLENILSGNEKLQIPDMIRRIGKRLFTTHLQDNFGLHDDHQAPGLGYIDWKSVLQAIQETGYQGPLMMELTGPMATLNRPVKQMRNFPLEKEIIFGSNYLNFIQQCEENNEQ